MSKELAAPQGAAVNLAAELVEKVVVDGNLANLAPAERLSYYRAVCESVGLNPLTKPFEYIHLNGKLRLYALKGATDQLRNLHGISIELEPPIIQDDLVIVTAVARDRTGRVDSDTGAVPIQNLKGEAKANAILKAITKAKRRVTLSMVGLGMLDETEVEAIPGAQVMPDAQLPEARRAPRLSEEKAASLAGVLEDAGIADALAFASDVTGRVVPALTDLNTAEATRVYKALPDQGEDVVDVEPKPARKNSIADEPITEGITAEQLAEAAEDVPWGDDQGGMFPPDEDLPESVSAEPGITPSQLKALHTRMTRLGFNGKKEDKDLAREFIGHMVGRALDSSKDLTKTEAGTLLDLDDDTLADALDAFKVERQMAAEGAA